MCFVSTCVLHVYLGGLYGLLVGCTFDGPRGVFSSDRYTDLKAARVVTDWSPPLLFAVARARGHMLYITDEKNHPNPN